MTNNNNISRVVLLLIPFFLEHFGSIECSDSEGNSLKNKCDAPVVTEGDTGVMTFFLRDSIDLDSDRVFVSLKRAKKPEEVLADCKKTSPLKCESLNLRYEISDGIVNHQLTLVIPNITTAFEDTYVLHVYVNDAPEPTDTCYLTVLAKNSKRRCSSPPVKEGETGVMTFYFHQDVDSSSNHLTAKLAKGGDGMREIISCHRKVGQSNFTCDVVDKLFTVDGPVQHSLTMRIPSITQNLQGHYILEVMDNNRHLHDELCYLRVEAVPASPEAGNTIADYIWLAIVFALLLVVIATFLGIIVFRQASIGNRQLLPCIQQQEPDGEIEMPLLSSGGAKTGIAQNKRWYFQELSDEDDNQWFNSERNAPGSFLVKVSQTNPKNYNLVVLLQCGIRYLTIVPKKTRLFCPSTGKSVHSLCEFVDYYREHDIKVRNTVWGRLTKPVEQEPVAECYFGKRTDDQAKEILQRNGPGSSLVMVSCLDDDSYDLVLNYGGKILFFGIVPEDDGFFMLDTHRIFKSVDEIVTHYTYNELKIDEHNYGKLDKPCKKDSEDSALD